MQTKKTELIKHSLTLATLRVCDFVPIFRILSAQDGSSWPSFDKPSSVDH